MSSRQSIGGDVFRDASSRTNRRSSSVPRRLSHGGNALLSPKRDRRAMLDAWRQTRNQEDSESNKRAKTVEAGDVSSQKQDGRTALERYRLRKQQKLQEKMANDENLRPPQHPTRFHSTFDDDDDVTGDYKSIASSVSTGTPSFKRRLASSGKARRRSLSVSSPFMPQSPLTQESEVQSSQPLSQGSASPARTEPDRVPRSQDEGLNMVETAVLRSRITEQQQRIDKLEKEKMDMSMSMAPLEARHRQKEDSWAKEQNRLLQEIDSLKQASREADESYRDLTVKYDALDEECANLRFAARKAASSLNNQAGDNTLWSRQLQNDRDVVELKDKLRHAKEEIKSLRLEKVSVEKERNATRIELDALARSFDELQGEYDELVASKSENSEAEIKLNVLTTEHIATAAQLNAVSSDLAATKARAQAAMDAKITEHKQEVSQFQFEISVLKARAAKVVDEVKSIANDEEDEAVLKAKIEERDRRIVELEGQLLEGEKTRRMMHNRIQELRGNIRVFVRTRPFLPADGERQSSSLDFFPDGEGLSIEDGRGGGCHTFKFDKVFPPSSGQESVFTEVADFVQSALDGYHVCLFSYGQTGSGKTHTMQGTGTAAMRGIIPRAVEQILGQARAMKRQKWDFTITASFLEIYNEDLKDLLVAMNQTRGHGKEKLSIKRPRDGKSFVHGLTKVNIETVDAGTGMRQLDSLMKTAGRARSVASTNMNAQSSRSHSVFMLHLHGFNQDSGAVVHGALNLCDLAGSERLDRSGVGSDMKRLRETQAINKSLSCLGDVFTALATGASHIPYRNSKLTYLLQDCLSGDGKALMFVNLSPTSASSNESLCSLRFAQRVNQVELGKPTKHIEYSKGGKR